MENQKTENYGGITLPDIDEIAIDDQGSWSINGKPVADQELTGLLNASLHLNDSGDICVYLDGIEKRVIVRDVPVFVNEAVIAGFGGNERVTITLSTGKTEELDIGTISSRNGRLYCRINNGSIKARFNTAPFYKIMEKLDEHNGNFYLNICGKSIIIREEDL